MFGILQAKFISEADRNLSDVYHEETALHLCSFLQLSLHVALT